MQGAKSGESPIRSGLTPIKLSIMVPAIHSQLELGGSPYRDPDVN